MQDQIQAKIQIHYKKGRYGYIRYNEQFQQQGLLVYLLWDLFRNGSNHLLTEQWSLELCTDRFLLQTDFHL